MPAVILHIWSSINSVLSEKRHSSVSLCLDLQLALIFCFSKIQHIFRQFFASFKSDNIEIYVR